MKKNEGLRTYQIIRKVNARLKFFHQKNERSIIKYASFTTQRLNTA